MKRSSKGIAGLGEGYRRISPSPAGGPTQTPYTLGDHRRATYLTQTYVTCRPHCCARTAESSAKPVPTADRI